MPRDIPRRGISVAISLIGVIAVCGMTGGCAPAAELPDEAAALSARSSVVAEGALVNESEQGEHVQITNLEVPGPAAGQAIELPNRLGSVTVPVRRYDPVEPAWAVLVWAHGGSFMRGTLDWPEADWVSRELATRGVRVYSVDYVLASDVVKAPAPANDVAAALEWVLDHEELPVAVGGASAGAHLAADAAHTQGARARATHSDVVIAEPLAALLLQYPTLHRVQWADAALAAATAAIPVERQFSAERIAEMYDFYLGGDFTDAVVVGERGATHLAVLPPTVIVNADADDLRASGEQFAEQLAAAGVPVSVSTQPGTLHGYLNRPAETPEAAAATIETFVAGMRRAIAGSEELPNT